jgi:hypothetical protein
MQAMETALTVSGRGEAAAEEETALLGGWSRWMKIKWMLTHQEAMRK